MKQILELIWRKSHRFEDLSISLFQVPHFKDKEVETQWVPLG